MIKYYVKNDKTGDILAKDGKWVSKPSSEDALSWDNKDSAESAKPGDVTCHVVAITRPDPRPELQKK